MALPADFSKIFGSTATGGLTPISDVNYAKGWEFVGANPPTKNDFSYLQQVSDLKSQYLYKVIGGDAGAPPIGIPFFWPSAAMPNTVMDEWADMVFLKFNGSTFSATTYPKLAKVFPSLTLTEARGEFPRIWDDGRGVDVGRALMSSQGDAMRKIAGTVRLASNSFNQNTARQMTGVFGWSDQSAGDVTNFSLTAESNASKYKNGGFTFDSSTQVPTASENRPRNIAFNFLVRAK